MERFEVVRLTYKEVSTFLSSVSTLDRLEAEAYSGKSWTNIVNLTLSRAEFGYEFWGLKSKTSDTVYAMGGVDKEDHYRASIWMLTANLTQFIFKGLRTRMLWTLKAHLRDVLKEWSYVSNVVWAGNIPHINLLKTLGFTIVWEDAYVNRHGETFIPFFKEA